MVVMKVSLVNNLYVSDYEVALTPATSAISNNIDTINL